ncbi:DUF3307 domain-containing protein [Candidatus Peregrinibacteria bacterium]|nr:DUF3307 domain-containing protein [Candidatus Peregrinibacteria bacterium]
MILSFLILTHLLGDFVLQPTKLVRWKMTSYKGTLVHSLVHFLIGLILLSPFIINGYVWLIGIIFTISLIHFFIDQAKISYDLKHDEKVKPFIIDQMLHLLAIMLVNFFLGKTQLILPESSFTLIYSDLNIINFFSFLVFAGSVIEIYNFQKKREKNAKAKLKFNKVEMIKRMLIFTMIYSVFTILGIYSYKFL